MIRSRLSLRACLLVTALAGSGGGWAQEQSPVAPSAAEVPVESPGPVVTQTPSVGRIVAIEFTGNSRTREEVMRREIGLQEGQPATGEQIEEARQAIMDLGLFEWVTAEVDETPDGAKVIFAVKEKIYFLPIPLLNGDPSKRDYSYGLELRADNLGGLNQRIKLKYETEHKTNNRETPLSRSGSIDYYVPRVMGTAYNLELGYGLTQEDFNAVNAAGNVTAEYHRNITDVDVGVSRWLNLVGPSRGWSGSVGLSYEQQAYTFLSGVPAGYTTEQAVSMTAGITWNDTHDKGYYYTGSAYGWRGALGDKVFGSDFDFTRHLFYYRTYNHITPKINLNWQLRLGFADGHPFNANAYSIGGFNTLRGHESENEGNALALSNFEYQHQLDAYPSIRGVWFLDLGNTWDQVTDMNPGKLEAGTGFGMRWRIQSLVNVTLSADAAWALGTGERVFYLMTSSAF